MAGGLSDCEGVYAKAFYLRKHLVCLVETEDFDVVGAESFALDHVYDATGSADDDLNTCTENGYIVTNVGTSDTGQGCDVQVVTEGHQNFVYLNCEFTSWSENDGLGCIDRQVKTLEDGNTEGGSLSSTRLSLGNDIAGFDDWNDSTGLNSTRTFETAESYLDE